MSVRIRLSRSGSKKKPFYRLVAADARMPRDGRFLEKVGYYNGISKELSVETEKVQKWLNTGAKPTTTVAKLLIKAGMDVPVPKYIPKQKKAD